MGCPSQNYAGGDFPNITWSNWSGRVGGPVGRLFKPNTLPDLVNVVARASNEGHRLRVVGSGWAFEDIAYSPDWMVSLENLSRTLSNVTGSALNSQWANQNLLFHVEAGAKVHQVNDALANAIPPLALSTLGGANGQAIGGVISTSTHGGDIAVPPFPDMVMAMHFVTVGGREVWVERASQPITDDVPLAMAFACPDAEIIRNDALFNAMLVGFGRFGVVYSYVLRVEPAFRLAEWTCKIPRVVLTTALRTGVANGQFLRPLLNLLPGPPVALGALNVANPRGLEVAFDSLNTDQCYVKRRWLSAGADLHNDDSENTLCKMGAAGVLAAAEGALVVLGGTPPWSLIPFFQVAVGVQQTQLAAALAANRNMTAGEMLSRAVTAFWDLQAGAFIPRLSAQQFDSAYADSMGDGKRGRSDQIISGFPDQSLQNCFRADSIEPAFDAHTGGYIDFLDAVIANVANLKQTGYISLRWCAASMATLSMHNFPSPNAVSIEVTSLKGLPDNQTWMNVVEMLALGHGGRPHWGQENHLTAPQVSQIFGPNLTAWKGALTALGGGSVTFSSAHTVQRGLEPSSQQATPTLFGEKAGDIIASLEPARSLLLTPNPAVAPRPIFAGWPRQPTSSPK